MVALNLDHKEVQFGLTEGLTQFDLSVRETKRFFARIIFDKAKDRVTCTVTSADGIERTFNAASLNTTQFTVGRSGNNDIPINIDDFISLSREHVTIAFDANTLKVSDHSKFGTHVVGTVLGITSQRQRDNHYSVVFTPIETGEKMGGTFKIENEDLELTIREWEGSALAQICNSEGRTVLIAGTSGADAEFDISSTLPNGAEITLTKNGNSYRIGTDRPLGLISTFGHVAAEYPADPEATTSHVDAPGGRRGHQPGF